MIRKHILILGLAIAIIGGFFIFSENIVNAVTVTRYCHNGPNNTNSGGCGTACRSLCDDANFFINPLAQKQCITTEASVNNNRGTSSWSKYRAQRIRRVSVPSPSPPPGIINPIVDPGEISFTFVRMEAVCSIGDKCNTTDRGPRGTCAIANSPLLRAGRCVCEDIGAPYKICCVREPNGNYRPINAIPAGSGYQDGQNPEEGMCPSGAITTAPNVTVCPSPPTVTLSAEPTHIPVPGPYTTLRWTTTGVTDCRLTSDRGLNVVVAREHIATGSRREWPPVTTIYTLTCSQIGNPNNTRSASVTVTVGPPLPLAFTVDINANPLTINRNSSSTLTWTSTGAGDCNISKTVGGLFVGGFGIVGPNGSRSVRPTTTTTYTLTCLREGANNTNPANIRSDEVTITVIQPSPSVSILADPNPVASGSPTTIRWNSTNATSCVATEGPGFSTRGQVNGDAWSTPLTSTTTFSIRCYGAAGTTPATASVTVTIGQLSSCVANILAIPPSLSYPGGSARLIWRTTNATNCTITPPVFPGAREAVGAQGTVGVNVTSTTTYTIRCDGIAGRDPCSHSARIVVLPAADIACEVDWPNSVTANVSATRTCLPFHQPPLSPGTPSSPILETTISWSGVAQRTCPALIGGGSASSYSASCINTSNNWVVNQPSGSIIASPTVTQAYSIECRRESYVCRSGTVFADGGECARSCAFLETTYKNTLGECVCSRFCAAGFWTDASCPCPPAPATCVPARCPFWTCTRWAYSQSVVSRRICPSFAEASQIVRFIQKPGIPTNELKTDSPRAEPLRTPMLLNQFINLIWRVTRPDSGVPGIPVPTTLRCTPSITRGDGTGWVRPSNNLDSLDSSGREENLSPIRTTDYQLICRNRDNVDPLRCYNDSDPARHEVRVFTPDLREIPAFRDGFMNIVKQIGDNFQ